MTQFPPLPPEQIQLLEEMIAPYRLTEWQRAVLGNQVFPRDQVLPLPRPPFDPATLEPYLRAMNRDLLTLSQASQVPIRFMTGAPIPLRDRMWARFQAFRRLLWKIQELTASSATGARSLGRRSAVTLRAYLRWILSR